VTPRRRGRRCRSPVVALLWLTVSCGVGAEPLPAVLERLSHPPAGSLATMPPLEGAWPALERGLVAVVAGAWKAASAHAEDAGYELIRVNGPDGGHVVFRDRGAVNATVVINLAPERELIVSAPHPVFDRGTGAQAAAFYRVLGARALIMAGAHRCAVALTTACSGTTGVCGPRGPYRLSDVAHAVHNVFHAAHQWAAATWTRTVVLQLHGFANRGSPVWFLLSSGSSGLEGDEALHHRLRDRIRRALGSAEVAASCQAAADRTLNTRWACGRWNVQGRLLNHSGDPCRVGTRTASQRFIHLEQKYVAVREAFHRGRGEGALEQPAVRALLEALIAELPRVIGR